MRQSATIGGARARCNAEPPRRVRYIRRTTLFHFELEGGDGSYRLRYTTFTIGPGVFHDIHLWKGLFIQPSVRWWPTVHSTMSAGAALRRADGTQVQSTSHPSDVEVRKNAVF